MTITIDNNQPARFTEQLTVAEQRALLDWIHANVTGWRRGSRRYLNSYFLKHVAENALGFYVTNGALKGAMDIAGWEPVDREAVNWLYRVSLITNGSGI